MSSVSRNLAKNLYRVQILSVLVIALMVILFVFFPNDDNLLETPTLDSTRADQTLFPEEIYPVPPGEPVGGTLLDGVPCLALVVDDFGNQWNSEAVQGILSMDLPMTIAVIPGLWASQRTIERAGQNGKDVLLHIPMEPLNRRFDLPKHFIHSGMTPDEVRSYLDENALDVPEAIGMNNHMGSAATQDSALMRTVAQWCAERNWILLDSITHPATVLYSLGRESGATSLKRDVFLDHQRDSISVARSLRHAADLALKLNRPIVVIAHPRQATWAVLRAEAEYIKDLGIRWVTISDIVNLM